MTSPLSRRQALRLVGLGATGVTIVTGAVDSPAGEIAVRGGQAVFSVDFPRPLESVIYTFARAYGWQGSFEEAPTIFSGDMIDVTRDLSFGIRVFKPRGGRLEFSYELGPNGAAPESPRDALEAAVAAHHRAGFPGRYRVISDQDFFHVVPIGRANEQGRDESIESPLDAVVTLGYAAWEPQILFNELLASMERQSGYRILEGPNPFSRGMQPIVEAGFRRVKARSVLREIIRATGKRRIWYLLYHIRTGRYAISVV